MFIEVPENAENFRVTETDGTEFEKLGEVTKEGITFDCSEISPPDEIIPDSKEKFMNFMEWKGIELREGFKFIVLKEK